MACGPRTSQDPERMDLVRENQLRGCPSISLQKIWKIWQPNWGCRPDRLKTFRFERKVLSCQSGKSQAAGRAVVGGGVGDVVGVDRPPLPRSTRRVTVVARRKQDAEKSVV